MAGTIAIAAPLVQSEAGAHVIRAGIQYEALLRDHHDRWASLISTATGRDTERQRWARGERAARARLAPNRPTARAGAPHVFWHGPDRVDTTGRPVVVLVNGWTASGLLWPAGLVEQLERSYDVVRVDNRGSGYSRTAPAPFTMTQLADDVREVLRAIGARSATIVGLSMGGMIAQELALNHADVVRSLTLCSTDAGQDPWLRVWLTSMSVLRPKCDARDFCHLFNPWLFAPQFFAQPGADEFLFGAFCANPFPQSAPAFVRQCNAILTHDTVNRLGSIAVPTHVIVGAQDILTPPHRSTILAERIPGAKLTVLPHLGHVASWENPGLFNDAVLGFVRGVDEALPA